MVETIWTCSQGHNQGCAIMKDKVFHAVLAWYVVITCICLALIFAFHGAHKP